MTGVRVVYTDIDGTMVGPYGCFFLDGDRRWTLEPARALVELHEAGVALVLVSGRTRAQLVEAAGLLGADGFVGELGAVVGWDRGRKVEVLRGAMPRDLRGTPVEAMLRGGLPDELFAAWPGRLAWHDPWHEGHDADLMFRGNVDTAAVEAWLAERGWGWLRMHDNGVLAGRTVPGTAEPVHVYHLLPDGIDKGRGVAADLARRGLRAEQAVAVGDSLSDLAMAPYVGRFHMVANGAVAPATAAAAASLGNVVTTRAGLGLGWAEAVRSALAAG